MAYPADSLPDPDGFEVEDTCPACRQAVADVDGCDGCPQVLLRTAEGFELLDRIPVGARDIGAAEEAAAECCPTCQADRGLLHHAWCGAERCPVCASARVTCCCDLAPYVVCEPADPGRGRPAIWGLGFTLAAAERMVRARLYAHLEGLEDPSV